MPTLYYHNKKWYPMPSSPYYVLSNDSFMSGWGDSHNKTNVCVVPCTTFHIAKGVALYIKTRKEQKYVRIVRNMPKPRKFVIYSMVYTWLYQAEKEGFIN